MAVHGTASSDRGRSFESTPLLLILLLLCCSFVGGQRTGNLNGPCRTPQNQHGLCVALDSCKALKEMFQMRPLPPATIDYLKRSQCGHQGKIPYVCCPTRSEVFRVAGSSSTSYGTSPGGARGDGPRTDAHPNLSLLPRNICGSEFSEKIIGGEEANLKQYPWLALLQYKTKDIELQYYCGGALINDRYILTAAHCVQGTGNSKLVGVRLGEHNTTTDPDCQMTDQMICADKKQDVGIEKIVIHPGYSPNRAWLNDMALVRLNRAVPFTEYVRPICLPEGASSLNNQYEGEKLFVAGWGKYANNASSSNVKLWIQVPVVKNSDCAPLYSWQLDLNPNQMCAGGIIGKDTCKGDSGGPLMSVEAVVPRRPGSQWVVAGVVSIGPKICGVHGKPGIYTRVGPYVDWILDQLRP